MNYLVTGGAGFIGSNIVEELMRRGHNVRVLDNFSTGRRTNLAPFISGAVGSEFLVPSSKFVVSSPRSASKPGTKNQELRTVALDVVEGDVRSPFTVMEAMSAPFRAGEGEGKGKGKETNSRSSTSTSSTSSSSCPIDFVLHQAALPSVPRSVKDPLTTNEVCVVGTLNVLKAAMSCGVKRVVYASSSSVYGNSDDLPKHEGMTPSPLSPYACAKLAGEHYCHVFSRLYGLEVVALRYFNVFGPRQDPNSQYSAVIPKFIAAIREGRRPIIYGDGEQSRDFTPVANVVAANIAACHVSLQFPVPGSKFAASETKNQEQRTTNFGNQEPRTSAQEQGTTNQEPFLLSNVAVGERYTLNYMVSEICRILGKHIEPIYEPPRPGDVKHSLASVDVLRERLGLTNPMSFQDGLEQLIRAEL